MRAAAAAPLLAAILLACGPEEPVLAGVQGVAGGENPARAEGYGRPEGVLVDAAHLGGSRYDGVRDVLLEQAGALRGTRALDGGDGEELTFERATVRVADGTIYMVRAPLPEPMRPADALAALGFAGRADDFVELSGELRLNNTLGQRRIRLKREGTGSAMVVEVESWHHVPIEGTTRR